MRISRTLARCVLLAAAAAALPHAAAHVVLEYQVAPAAASYKATFKVGHGCGESPTRQIVVTLPAGVRGAHPMPKPGWAVEVTAQQVRWTARTREDMLASSHYDEFVLVARLPEQAGPLYWPVNQACEQGAMDWVQVPAPGQNPADLKAPAALLEVLPAGLPAGHNH